MSESSRSGSVDISITFIRTNIYTYKRTFDISSTGTCFSFAYAEIVKQTARGIFLTVLLYRYKRILITIYLRSKGIRDYVNCLKENWCLKDSRNPRGDVGNKIER